MVTLVTGQKCALANRLLVFPRLSCCLVLTILISLTCSASGVHITRRGSASKLVQGEREALLGFAEAHAALHHILTHPLVTDILPQQWAPLRSLLARAKVRMQSVARGVLPAFAATCSTLLRLRLSPCLIGLALRGGSSLLSSRRHRRLRVRAPRFRIHCCGYSSRTLRQVIIDEERRLREKR